MELKFLRSELTYQEEVLSVAHQDFEMYYREWCENNEIDLQELNKNNQERVDRLIPDVLPKQKHDEKGALKRRSKRNSQTYLNRLQKLHILISQMVMG